MRSAGAVAQRRTGEVWLRVVVEDADYEPVCRWDGNVAANSILGVAKPTVLRWHDWRHAEEYLWGRRLRGEVMTLAPGTTVAPGGVLRDDPRLSDSWWHELGWSLAALATHPMQMAQRAGRGRVDHPGRAPPLRRHAVRGGLRRRHLDHRARRPALGQPAAAEGVHPRLGELAAGVRRIRPGHALLQQPAPPAHGPPHPRDARTETRSGHLALLSAICRYLRVVGEGSDWDLLEPHLRAEAATVLSKLTRTNGASQ